MLRAHRSRLAAMLLAAIFAVTGVSAAALMPTPAYADAISNAYNLNGYKIMSDLDTIAQARYNEPAAYQSARWDGTRWQSQAAYVNDQKAAYIRSLSGYQATPAVANTSHATQMATQTVNGRTTAGASTVLKQAEAAEAASKFKLPAFKAGTLVKGAGTGLVAVTGLQVGFEAGKFGMKMFGFDYDGLICGSGSDALATAYGSDCPDTMGFATGFEPNKDAVGGTDWGSRCLSDGFCITLGARVIAGDDYEPFFRGRIVQPANYTGPRSADPFKGNWAIRTKNDGYESTQFPYTHDSLDQDSTQVGRGYQKLCAQIPSKWDGCFQPDKSMQAWAIIDTATGAQTDFVNPKTVSGDPERQVICEVRGSDGKQYVAQTGGYVESSGKMPSPQCPALPDGVTPTKLDVSTQTKDGTVKTPLLSEDATPAYQNAQQAYPECQTGQCTLDLVQVSSDRSCFELDQACNGWMQDTAKDTKYACYYGSHKVELRQCNVYAQVFDPAKRAAGNPYAMPDGSDPGMQSTLTDGQKAFSSPVQDPTNVRTCIAENVSMNPITWVQYPVQCAWQWATVPRDVKVKESVYNAKTAWDKTAPVKLATAVGAWDFKPVMTGCNGIGYPPDLIYKGMAGGRLGDACPGTPLATAAKFTYVILGIITGVGGALAIASYMGWTIGYRGPSES